MPISQKVLIKLQSDHVLYITRYIFRTLSISVNSDTFRHIHVLFRHIEPYCGTFRSLCDFYIQNPAIFRILEYLEPKTYSELCQGISWHIQNAVQHSHIQNPTIFRNLEYLGPKEYSEPCLYRHIQANSGIFNNDNFNGH